jgi:hypothetical protein
MERLQGRAGVTVDGRLRAVSLSVPFAREVVGRHEYDGVVQDLSPDGIRRALAALGGPAEVEPYDDPYDEALVAAAENALRVRFGELELHRVNPLWHNREPRRFLLRPPLRGGRGA